MSPRRCTPKYRISRIFQKEGVTQSRGFVKLGQVPWSSSRRFQKNGVTKSRRFVKHVYIHFGYSYHCCVMVFGRVLLTPWWPQGPDYLDLGGRPVLVLLRVSPCGVAVFSTWPPRSSEKQKCKILMPSCGVVVSLILATTLQREAKSSKKA